MNTARPDLLNAASRLLGPCETARFAGGQVPGAVLRVRDRTGREFIVKRHCSMEQYHREVAAYRTWAPALADRAPALVAADPGARVIVITAIPGRPCPEPGSPSEHRQAGALLRLLHEAEPARRLTGFRQWLDHRVRSWRERADPLLAPADRALIDRHLSVLARFDAPLGGPAHLDYQPRNWLADRDGTLRVIDFEHARIDVQARDFVRLAFRYWSGRAGLRAAFLAGYGRELTSSEWQIVESCAAIDVVTALGRGVATGNHQLTSHGQATLRLLHLHEVPA